MLVGIWHQEYLWKSLQLTVDVVEMWGLRFGILKYRKWDELVAIKYLLHQVKG